MENVDSSDILVSPGPDSSSGQFMVVEERIITQNLQPENLDDCSESHEDITPVIVTCGTLIIRTKGSSESTVYRNEGAVTKTVRDFKCHEEQTDAIIRGDNTVTDPEIVPHTSVDHPPCKRDQMNPLSDDQCSLDLINSKGTMECSNDNITTETEPSCTSEFIVKYVNNTVTCVQPGNFSVDHINNRDLSETSYLAEIENKGNEQDSCIFKEENKKSEEIFVKEQLKVAEEVPETAVNVLDEPLFPDFSLSVLRFQEAIESFTQAVFSDAFDSLNSEENKTREITEFGEEIAEQNINISHANHEVNFEKRESDKSKLNTQSCELFGENTVKFYEPLEEEIVEECFEAQTAAFCGDLKNDITPEIVLPTTFSSQGNRDGVFENTDNNNESVVEIEHKEVEKVVSEKPFVEAEFLSGCETNIVKETMGESHEHPKAILTFTEIPIIRANSDSAALSINDNILSITDISEQGCTEDYTDCCPIIQEVEDDLMKKLSMLHENIVLEDLSSSDFVHIHSDQWSSGKILSVDSIQKSSRPQQQSLAELHLAFERKIEESQMEDIVEISREIPQQIIEPIRCDTQVDTFQICSNNPDILTYDCQITESTVSDEVVSSSQELSGFVNGGCDNKVVRTFANEDTELAKAEKFHQGKPADHINMGLDVSENILKDSSFSILNSNSDCPESTPLAISMNSGSDDVVDNTLQKTVELCCDIKKEYFCEISKLSDHDVNTICADEQKSNKCDIVTEVYQEENNHQIDSSLPIMCSYEIDRGVKDKNEIEDSFLQQSNIPAMLSIAELSLQATNSEEKHEETLDNETVVEENFAGFPEVKPSIATNKSSVMISQESQDDKSSELSQTIRDNSKQIISGAYKIKCLNLDTEKEICGDDLEKTKIYPPSTSSSCAQPAAKPWLPLLGLLVAAVALAGLYLAPSYMYSQEGKFSNCHRV